MMARLPLIVLAVLLIGLFVAGIPSRYVQLLTVSPDADSPIGELRPEDADVLNRMRLSVGFYARFITALEAISALPFFLVGLLLIWYRSSDWMALSIAINGLLLGTLAVPVLAGIVEILPWMGTPFVFLRTLGVFSLFVLMFLFPDGRFVPGWTRWLSLLLVPFFFLSVLFPTFNLPMGLVTFQSSDIPLLVFFLTWAGIAVATQVYRYRNVSTPVQKQQTKWVVFGASIMVILLIVTALPNILFASLRQPGVLAMSVRLVAVTVILLVIIPILPITVGLSIFRYRLWDIDLIIRRTLVYGLLTVLLAFVYFGVVILVQNILVAITDQRLGLDLMLNERSPLAIVLSTLAIAALFNPLRRRIQVSIDRRFYRNKYNARKTVEAYALRARDEADLDNLTDDLVQVVEETMQPERLSLWMLKANK